MKTSFTYAALFLASGLFCTARQANAQLTVVDSLSTSDIAQLLEGLNLSISNVVVNCPGAAIGQFMGTSELDMEEGLVLTSGSADAVAAPVSAFASSGYMTPGDPDLTNDAGVETYDACVLEFDCIPYGDTLLFNFSFGSEEYPEFVGSFFNDIFAIYLSGPGFPFPVNAAQLPDGTPVAINNVNDLSNSDYYHDNEAALGQYVAYDGFTVNLTAFAEVQPEETYHFKVAIADAGDMVFDSGVFLEAFSFRSVVLITGAGEQQTPTMGLQQQGDRLRIQLPSGMTTGQLFVYDAMGRQVKQVMVAHRTMDIGVADLPTGAYTVVLRNAERVAPARFVKQ